MENGVLHVIRSHASHVDVFIITTAAVQIQSRPVHRPNPTPSNAQNAHFSLLK